MKIKKLLTKLLLCSVVVSCSDELKPFIPLDNEIIDEKTEDEKTEDKTTNIIEFADPYVKAICLSNWDTDYDGELSYVEAARVTSLGGVFSNIELVRCVQNGIPWYSGALILGNHSILTFNELEYFTGITEITSDDFAFDINLYQITIPENVKKIDGNSSLNFRGASPYTGKEGYGTVYYGAFTETNLSRMIMKSHQPPVLISPLPDRCKIYVPEGTSETYKSDVYWSTYADRILEYNL